MKLKVMKKTILHLCADIGSDTKPYADRPDEYEVICVGKKIGVENYHPPEGVYGVIANPPCTMFSIARTKAKTPRDMVEGMRLVKECLRIIWECQYHMISRMVPHKLNFWAIENPSTGYLKHYLGKPAYEYCQAEYGAEYTKATALWGYFNVPKKPLLKVVSKKTMGGDYGGASFDFRFSGDGGGKAICPPLFAKAFFEANK